MLVLYRRFISPALHFWAGPGFGCRFHPTCSEYADHSIREHGWIRGSGLALFRIIRCHPWGRGGWDPVLKRNFKT